MNETAPPQDSRWIARRAGWCVIGLGIADLAYGGLSAPPGMINFRIVGILAGLLILFGGLKVHAVVRWLALLVIGGMLLGPILPFVVVPASLTLTQIRLYPIPFALSCIPWLLWMAMMGVAAGALSHPLLLAARVRAGRPVHSARIPLVIGIVLAAGAAVVQVRVLDGEAGRKASRLVAERLGPGYRYYTQTLQYTRPITAASAKPAVVSAMVQAWNEREVLNVPVRWEE